MKRTLRIIDFNVSLSSPSMKGVIHAWDRLAGQGFQVEVWCWNMDAGLPAASILRLPSFGAAILGPLQALVFSLQVTLLHLLLHGILRRPRPDVIYSVVPYLASCDVAHGHFSPWDYEWRLGQLGAKSLRERLENLAMKIYRLWHDGFLLICRARLLLVPSKSVAADFQARVEGLRVEVLPNAFDPARFHPGVREAWREQARAELGFKSAETVFIFVSTGHYRRKGFFLAVGAVEQLRARGHAARLLVVGGKPKTLERLQQTLDATNAGWREWMAFTGSTPAPEKYFAAADGFLFPSYSEAFALVEVEAAACGLPLFLTPHHGSEMILEDGQNGRLIPFDADGIAQVLEEFISGRWQPACTGARAAFDGEAFAGALIGWLEFAARESAKELKSGDADRAICANAPS